MPIKQPSRKKRTSRKQPLDTHWGKKKSSAAAKDFSYVTECGHKFCLKCLKGWCKRSSGRYAQCPMCRRKINCNHIPNDQRTDDLTREEKDIIERLAQELEREGFYKRTSFQAQRRKKKKKTKKKPKRKSKKRKSKCK